MNINHQYVVHDTDSALASQRLRATKWGEKKHERNGGRNDKEVDRHKIQEGHGGEGLLDIHGLLEILQIIKGIEREQQTPVSESSPDE